MKLGVVVLSAAAVLAAASVVRAENGSVIVAGGPRDQQRIGSYHFLRDRTYAAALRAFGRPAALGPAEQGGTCTARWTKLGLEIRFSSTGADPCSGASLGESSWSGATVYAGSWRTDKGLRVGDDVSTLRRLYPKARYRDRPPDPPSWLLVYRVGEVGLTVYLQAYVWGGRVTAIDVPPGNLSVARA